MSRPSPAIAATLVQVSSRSDDLRDVILRFVILIAAIPLVAAQADTASAQFVGFYRGPIYPYGVGAWNYPYYGRSLSYGRGWGNRMVGTALSSNEFGMAQMIRASGYANLQDSKATENTLQARSEDLGNRTTWTSDYYQMRQAHRGHDASQDRLSMQDVTRIAHDAAPHDLDVNQANPTTGKIAWPVILQDARFIEDRDEVEHLYRSRATRASSTPKVTWRSTNRARRCCTP